MGKVHHPIEQGFGAAARLTGKCFDCDAPSEAYWAGSNGTVEVCRGCATDTLPKLIADAVLYPANPQAVQAERALPAVEAAYWRGVAAATSAALRREQEKNRGGATGHDLDAKGSPSGW